MSETKKEIRGNLGKDPELRRSVRPCVKFPIAVNTKDENGNKLTTWYTVFSYVDLKELMCLTKGKECRVKGTLREKQIGRFKYRHIIVEDNETDIISFTRNSPPLRNNYYD